MLEFNDRRPPDVALSVEMARREHAKRFDVPLEDVRISPAPGDKGGDAVSDVRGYEPTPGEDVFGDVTHNVGIEHPSTDVAGNPANRRTMWAIWAGQERTPVPMAERRPVTRNNPLGMTYNRLTDPDPERWWGPIDDVARKGHRHRPS